MTRWRVLGAGTAALVFYLPWAGMAFECPKHIAKAETAITAAVERVAGQLDAVTQVAMNDTTKSTAQVLLANARILLRAARSDHGSPQGPSDHACAIAKAHAALGYARATKLLVAIR